MKNNKLIIYAMLILCLFITVPNVKADDKVFDVAITGIISKNKIGKASDLAAPSFTDNTATFKTGLYLPGDEITYEVTVKNRGKIKAILKKINITDTSNPAIQFTYSGIKEGDTLSSSAETTFDVTVTYNENVTTQPENLVSNLTIMLDYEQGEEVPVVTPPDGMIDMGGNVQVPATSAYASITVILLGLLCVIVSVIITRRMTESKDKS